MKEVAFDINGREIKQGDIVRTFHYMDGRTGCKVYMHKLVFAVNDNLELDAKGKYLYAVSIVDIWRHGSIREAHKCPLGCDPEGWEIIDGHDDKGNDGEIVTWYERPKRKAADAAKGANK